MYILQMEAIQHTQDFLFFVTDPYLWSQLQKRHARDHMHNIFDGREYKNLVQSGFLCNKSNVSLTLNTDGVEIYRSSKSSLWPIWLQINELPPTQR